MVISCFFACIHEQRDPLGMKNWIVENAQAFARREQVLTGFWLGSEVLELHC